MGPMETVVVRSERGDYPVTVGTGLLGRGEPIRRMTNGTRRLLVTDTTVGPLHGLKAGEAVDARAVVELPPGEPSKAWPQVERILAAALAAGLGRGDVLVAVGGGVVTDMTGFAASILMRGVRWLAAPTTVLAMVDAAVGGKTGINLPQGKNLAGTFWPPLAVVADVGTLRTLPEREIRAGLAEVVKAAWIGDRELLGLLDPLPDPAETGRWTAIVARAVRVKAQIVEQDERESGLRRVLNLGHTLGHALEAATEYRRFLHGEAVAWGMLAAGRIALGRGLLSEEAWHRLETAIATLGPLPPVGDLGIDSLEPFLARDKKRDAAGVAWVLPTDGGVAADQRIAPEELMVAWNGVRTECGSMVGR